MDHVCDAPEACKYRFISMRCSKNDTIVYAPAWYEFGSRTCSMIRLACYAMHESRERNVLIKYFELLSFGQCKVLPS